jgi:2-polyprenyl-6-hydroxyphenyl methylase/3-demethylubiquinone-9 3-methyltransferase
VADLHGLESGVSVRYKNIPAEEMAEAEAGQYDVVTCMEMLEHVLIHHPSFVPAQNY